MTVLSFVSYNLSLVVRRYVRNSTSGGQACGPWAVSATIHNQSPAERRESLVQRQLGTDVQYQGT